MTLYSTNMILEKEEELKKITELANSLGIELTIKNPFNKYNCVPSLRTLSHKDYCCPFCSHGETIHLKFLNQ